MACEHKALEQWAGASMRCASCWTEETAILRERLAEAEAALKMAAGCIAPPEMFADLGIDDDRHGHIYAQRVVDAYFAKHKEPTR